MSIAVALDYDALLRRTAEAHFVLLGEASHGTHEFYRERAEITKRLITEQGFTVVAVEGDWPDAYRVNRYLRGASVDRSAEEALRDFRRFPAWMWRNTDVVEFVEWLREWNDSRPRGHLKAGFYGLDLYSLHASMEAVVDYLEQVDPDAAERARARYACFDHFGSDQVYAYEAGIGGVEPCEPQAVEQLVELCNRAATVAARNGDVDTDAEFFALQNARLVVSAQRYYREAFRGGPESWNLRDRHMSETLENLVDHLEGTRGPTKAVVWAHNSHVGDARATQLSEREELNIGQLIRAWHPDDAVLVGFSTYTGTVTAASRWGMPAECRRVRPALAGSWEECFHRTGRSEFVLETAGHRGRLLQRAIGVVYLPQTERLSHYFEAAIADQFDVMVHLDETTAVEPLERSTEWERELPDHLSLGRVKRPGTDSR